MTLEAKGADNICEEMQYRVGPQSIYAKSLRECSVKEVGGEGIRGLCFETKKFTSQDRPLELNESLPPTHGETK